MYIVKQNDNKWTFILTFLKWCINLKMMKKIKLLYRFSGKRYGNYCSHIIWRSLWLRLYGSWIYNYLCNLWLSPLTLWVRILLRRCVLDTTLCDKVCQWLAAGLWFFFVYSVSSTNKTSLTIVINFHLNTIFGII
jgi:hypothetical protein